MSPEAAQLRLLTWFSPAFPVGAFGYSHGLETAIREGRVVDGDTLEAWITGLIEHGSGWSDAVLFKLAWGADEIELAELAELAAALAPSKERHRETMQLGAAFEAAVRPWGRTPPQSLRDSSPASGGASTAQILHRAAGEVDRVARRRGRLRSVRPPFPRGENLAPHWVSAAEPLPSADERHRP